MATLLSGTHQVPQIVMDFLVDRAIEALETGGTISFSIHAKGPLCGDVCMVHPQ